VPPVSIEVIREKAQVGSPISKSNLVSPINPLHIYSATFVDFSIVVLGAGDLGDKRIHKMKQV
jgi:hypothetical protein